MAQLPTPTIATLTLSSERTRPLGLPLVLAIGSFRRFDWKGISSSPASASRMTSFAWEPVLGGLGVDRVSLSSSGMRRKRNAARPGERAAATRRGVGDAEALGQETRGEVVQVAPAARDLADERLLEGGGHPNEDAASSELLAVKLSTL